jgi:hypothetical protein
MTVTVWPASSPPPAAALPEAAADPLADAPALPSADPDGLAAALAPELALALAAVEAAALLPPELAAAEAAGLLDPDEHAVATMATTARIPATRLGLNIRSSILFVAPFGFEAPAATVGDESRIACARFSPRRWVAPSDWLSRRAR